MLEWGIYVQLKLLEISHPGSCDDYIWVCFQAEFVCTKAVCLEVVVIFVLILLHLPFYILKHDMGLCGKFNLIL